MRTAEDLLKRKKKMKKRPLARPGVIREMRERGIIMPSKGLLPELRASIDLGRKVGDLLGVVGGQGNG